MSLPEATLLEERNKTLVRSFIEEIFNQHNLPSIGMYFGHDSVLQDLLKCPLLVKFPVGASFERG